VQYLLSSAHLRSPMSIDTDLHTHTHTHSISLSLTHTYTHTNNNNRHQLLHHAKCTSGPHHPAVREWHEAQRSAQAEVTRLKSVVQRLKAQVFALE
jgi:hypothetical protein